MSFWCARLLPYRGPVDEEGWETVDEQDEGPIWFRLPRQPTTWIPFEQSGGALVVARLWGMRSIGVTAPLAILARDAITARTLPADSFERAFAVVDKLRMDFEAEQIRAELAAA